MLFPALGRLLTVSFLLLQTNRESLVTVLKTCTTKESREGFVGIIMCEWKPIELHPGVVQRSLNTKKGQGIKRKIERYLYICMHAAPRKSSSWFAIPFSVQGRLMPRTPGMARESSALRYPGSLDMPGRTAQIETEESRIGPDLDWAPDLMGDLLTYSTLECSLSKIQISGQPLAGGSRAYLHGPNSTARILGSKVFLAE
ncbi:hypothetical protein B0H17DRAFT_1145966 [Mycena rosella]|uniref:Uncharacterized protein n=1 Tax=Mycena rosella TaxID=1033263 RepID=A0AAD7CPV3_MYCRO|nr:hypothetical protein B0H17DRAFT_1145966 [Mycena rosella]